MVLEDEKSDHLQEQFGPFRPLASRLSVPISISIAVLLVATLCFVMMYGLKRSQKQIEHEAKMIGLAIGYAAETLNNDSALQRMVSSMAAEPGVEEITVVAGSPPCVLASSQMRLIGNTLTELETLQDWSEYTGSHSEAYQASHDRPEMQTVTRSIPVMISRTDKPLEEAAVLVRIQTQTIKNEAVAWAIAIALVLITLPALTLFVAWKALKKNVVGPIYAMADAVREGGEFAHIPIAANDEIGLLANVINRTHREAATSAIELADSREEAENALREIAALRRALDEHMILSIADKSGKIIDANKGFCKIAGYARDEILGEDHRVLNSGYHSKAFWIDVWKTIANGKAWRGEVCNKAKDGSRYWVDSTIVPYLNARGEIERYVSIRFDITAQKKAEEALVAAQEKAESISRSKSDFLANMSHEIRTPMTAIIGFTDLLKLTFEDSGAHDEHSDYVETIQRNGKHLLELINDILDVSKIEAGGISLEQTETNPQQVARDVCELMEVKAEAKGLGLRLKVEDRFPDAVWTDPARLRQILLNLIGNAIKFTDAGMVEVRCGYETPETSTTAGTMWFEVEDTGIGMSAEQQSRLFDAFMQADTSTSRKYGGTGLGLHISKQLIEMMGGEISVKSSAGVGSTFRFTIQTRPITSQEATAARRDVGISAAKSLSDSVESDVLQGVRILLAEDGPDNVRLITHFLSRAGASVETVENGRELLETLTVDGTIFGRIDPAAPYDLVLSDIQMPEIDGYEAATRLRAMGCTLPLIALTANAMSGDDDKCVEAGFDEYVSKPIEWKMLIRLCAQAATGTLRLRPDGTDTDVSEAA